MSGKKSGARLNLTSPKTPKFIKENFSLSKYTETEKWKANPWLNALKFRSGVDWELVGADKEQTKALNAQYRRDTPAQIAILKKWADKRIEDPLMIKDGWVESRQGISPMTIGDLLCLTQRLNLSDDDVLTTTLVGEAFKKATKAEHAYGVLVIDPEVSEDVLIDEFRLWLRNGRDAMGRQEKASLNSSFLGFDFEVLFDWKVLPYMDLRTWAYAHRNGNQYAISQEKIAELLELESVRTTQKCAMTLMRTIKLQLMEIT